MPAEYERPYRQDQRLKAQQHGMDDADGIDAVEHEAPEEAGLGGLDQVVIAAVGIGAAA